MTSATPRFSRETLQFIQKAQRQKREDWLDRNREEYVRLLQAPLQELARQLKQRLSRLAPDYNFPQKGLARLKRSANRAEEYGALYRDYVNYSASRPRESRFDTNPNLFFMIYPNDEDGDQVLLAGGLYMPSSRQTRAIREAIAQDASPFDRLFKTKAFASRFPGGFSREKSSSRNPRGFPAEHPRMDWLRLQAFFVWRSYSLKEFTSARFAELIASDCQQILKLNALLELAIQGRWSDAAPRKETRATGLLTRLEEYEAPRRKMDF